MNLPKLLSRAGLLVASVLVSSCGGSSYSGPPQNQSNICSIFEQRPDWQEAVEDSADKWGAPVPVQMAIIWRESSFRSDVRPPKKYTLGFIPNGHISSAYGFAQAIDGTWEWYQDATGNSSADRTDWEDATDFVGWYMSQSRRQNGIGMSDAYNQYLAYHEGHAGHRRGTFRRKGWLVRTARKVQERAQRYSRQYSSCS